MEDWEKNADKYCNQVDKIALQMREDDFFDSHTSSEMRKMLEKLIGAETQLSQIYTGQKKVTEKLFEKNGGGADNEKARKWDNELTEIKYFCEIARDFIPELEEMLQEKGEKMEEKGKPEEVFEGLSDMREPAEDETEELFEEEEVEDNTIEFDGEIAEEYKKEAKKMIRERTPDGKSPTDVIREGAETKRKLMAQIQKTMKPAKEDVQPKLQKEEKERE